MSCNPARRKHEEILELIALYRAQPCLWDNNLEESRSVNARKVALDDIAGRMNVSSDNVRKKLHNLRSQYRRENLRIKRLKTNRPKWLYYNALKFLGPAIKSKPLKADPLDALSDFKKLHSEEVDLEYDKDTDSDVDDEFTKCEDNPQPSDLTHSTTNKLPPATEDYREDRIKLSSSKKDPSKRVIVIPRQSEQRDDYAVFGENVANELRSLENNKSLQHALKCTILQAILDINKSSYDTAPITDSFEMEETHLEEY